MKRDRRQLEFRGSGARSGLVPPDDPEPCSPSRVEQRQKSLGDLRRGGQETRVPSSETEIALLRADAIRESPCGSAAGKLRIRQSVAGFRRPPV